MNSFGGWLLVSSIIAGVFFAGAFVLIVVGMAIY